MNRKTKRLITDILLKVLAAVVIFMIFLPIFIMLPSMFKGSREIFSYPWHFFPQKFTSDNFSCGISSSILTCNQYGCSLCLRKIKIPIQKIHLDKRIIHNVYSWNYNLNYFN